jgi:hypothetical protein
MNEPEETKTPSEIPSPPGRIRLALIWLGKAIRRSADFIRGHVWTLFLVLFWIIMISLWSVSIYISFVLTTRLPDLETSLSACQLKEVKVYDQERKNYGLWERKEAIKFSIDLVDSSINYLFIGAAAILGYVLKILIEPQLDTKEGEHKVPPEPAAGNRKQLTTPFVKLLLIHAALGSIISIANGFYARQFLASVGDRAVFSIYGEVQYGVLGQLIAFFIAALLMIWAAIAMVTSKGIKSKESM